MNTTIYETLKREKETNINNDNQNLTKAKIRKLTANTIFV